MPNVFISHSSKDRGFVENLLIPLFHSQNITTWYSRKDISGASVWENSIRQGLESSDWFLVVISPEAIQSEWVKTEVHWTMEYRKERIIPLLISDCKPIDLHLQLIRYQQIDILRDGKAAYSKLLAIWGILNFHTDMMKLSINIKTNTSLEILKEYQKTFVISECATLGRAPNCEIFIEGDKYVSRKHAELIIKEINGTHELILFNLGVNGTIANGKFINSHVVKSGDIINIGKTEITIVLMEALSYEVGLLEDKTAIK